MDVEILASSLGRSIDDTILCIHIVLVQMTAHMSNRKLKFEDILNGRCLTTATGLNELVENSVQRFGLS